MICEARLRGAPTVATAIADLWLRDGEGRAFGRVVGLQLKRASRAALLEAAAGIDDLLYELAWHEVALPGGAAPPGGGWLLLGDAGRAGALAAALAAQGATVLPATILPETILPETGTDPARSLAGRAGRGGGAWRGGDGGGVAGRAGGAARCRSGRSGAGAGAGAEGQALLSTGLALPQGLAVITEGAVATAPGEDADAAGGSNVGVRPGAAGGAADAAHPADRSCGGRG